MYLDRALAARQRARTARDHAVDILFDAWSDAPTGTRAAMIAAQGDVARAAAYGGGAWAALFQGDVAAALQSARDAIESPGMAFLEAEALFGAGAVVAGLKRFEALYARGDPAGTLALARRRHQLGDHGGAVRAALAMPWHAHAALAGARAALVERRADIAFRFVEPLLQGLAPVPEPATAGAVAMTTASILAGSGEQRRLRRFADRLINTGDLTDDMMPAIARAAWTGGRAREAWQRFEIAKGTWAAAARLELAILAGDLALAERLAGHAGPLGTLSAPALHLLGGTAPDSAHEIRQEGDPFLTDRAREVFGAGHTVHVWRTHPYRWQPWIEAALRTPAEVTVCDLATGRLPDAEIVPGAVFDDGALVEALVPVPVSVAVPSGTGVRVGAKLCRGVGIGHDWPREELEALRRGLPAAPVEGEAAVQVLGADDALGYAHAGRAVAVVAPPGDPFWAGPLPERVWPSFRIVRADPSAGWTGAGARVAAAVDELLRAAGG